MTRVLDPLLRLKTHQRRESTLALRQAEAERDRQAERVDAIHRAMERERKAVDPSDGNDLALWAAWRLQSELAARRETVRLAQRNRDVEVAVGKHRREVQEELSLEAVIQARKDAEAEEARRTDAKRMDEIAARRVADERRGGE